MDNKKTYIGSTGAESFLICDNSLRTLMHHSFHGWQMKASNLPAVRVTTMYAIGPM